jgi:hypothetical protein
VDVHAVDLKLNADGVVQTRLPMRPLPAGIPSSGREAGASKVRSARETSARRSTWIRLSPAAAMRLPASIAMMTRIEVLHVLVNFKR